MEAFGTTVAEKTLQVFVESIEHSSGSCTWHSKLLAVVQKLNIITYCNFYSHFLNIGDQVLDWV